MDNLIVENIKHRPLRTAISIIGVALGVILIVLMVGLAHGMTDDSNQRQSNVDAEIRFMPEEFGSSAQANPLIMPARYAEVIMKGVQPTTEDPDIQPRPPIAGVISSTPIGELLQSTEGGIGYGLVDGIDYASFAKTTTINLLAGRPLGDGKTPGAEYEAIVDRFYSEHNTDVNGEAIGVGSKISALGHEFTVVGIYEPSMLARIKIPLYTMQQLTGGAENCTFVLVRTEKPELAKQVKADLEKTYPGHRAILTSELPALFSQNLRLIQAFLNVVIWLAIIISTLVILLAMYTTIIERTREIGILKSLGASKPFIVYTIEKEAALISALGVALGFTIALVGKYFIEKNTTLIIEIEFVWLVIAAIIGLACGIVGALYPAIRAANLDPIDALSFE
ncbi:MAG: FtsX-like permease family protein [Acidobacteriota bacterium]